MADLNGKRIAILVEKGFEQEELIEPKRALEKTGAHADIISPAGNQVRAWNHSDWGDTMKVDVPLDQALPAFDRKMIEEFAEGPRPASGPMGRQATGTGQRNTR